MKSGGVFLSRPPSVKNVKFLLKCLDFVLKISDHVLKMLDFAGVLAMVIGSTYVYI